MGTLGRVLSLGKPFKRYIITGLILLVVMNATRLILPKLTGVIIDDVIKGGHFELLYTICGALLALVLVRASSHYIRAYSFERASQGVVFNLRVNLYEHLQQMPYEFYDKNRVGEIMSRMTGDIEGIRNFFAGAIINICENSMWFIGSMLFLFFINWKLALVLLAMAPLVAVCGYRFSKHVRPAHRAIREQNAVLNDRTQENISGVRVVKAFAREDYEKERFDHENLTVYARQMSWVKLWAKYYPQLEFAASLCTPLMLVFGGYMVVRGEISLGDLVAFNGYIWMINAPMRNLGNIINSLNNAISSAEKLFYYQDLGPSIADRPGCISPDADSVRGDIRFDHVSFSYGDEPVLRDLCIDAPAGSTVAIMGPTGSGKSSVVNLMSRFYECQEGVVSLDGVDVKDYSMATLRRCVGYVAQETFLFSETIANNIAFGRPDATMDEIVAAAKIAQAHDFIMATPQGYDTVVGERGMGLSGGQKQRIAIARAILYRPKVLVMDDSTSAVDMETEFEIQQQMKSVMGSCTLFIIAHRISSVRSADQILVMDGGHIIERGTHEELLALDGAYRDMYNEQVSALVQTKGGEA